LSNFVLFLPYFPSFSFLLFLSVISIFHFSFFILSIPPSSLFHLTVKHIHTGHTDHANINALFCQRSLCRNGKLDFRTRGDEDSIRNFFFRILQDIAAAQRRYNPQLRCGYNSGTSCRPSFDYNIRK